MAVTAGAPITQADMESLVTTDIDTDFLSITPTPSTVARHIEFNHGYEVYVDNTGTGAAAVRFWLDMPDTGDIVLGPRSGSSFVNQLRLRTNATTATAANCFIDSTTQQIKRSTSSRRYKVDIQDADLDLARVRALRPVTFQDKTEHAEQGDTARRYIGFIAEEVDELGLNEFVYYDTETGLPESVQYDRIVVGLLGLAKDLYARVEALEAAR